MSANTPTRKPALPPSNDSVRSAVKELVKHDPEGIYSAAFMGITDESIDNLIAHLDPRSYVNPESRLGQIQTCVGIISENQAPDFVTYPEEQYVLDQARTAEHFARLDRIRAAGSAQNPITIDDDDEEVSGDFYPVIDNVPVKTEHFEGNDRFDPVNASEIDAVSNSGDQEDDEIQEFHECSDTRFEHDDQGSEYVEFPDNEENVEGNAGDDDASEQGVEYVEISDDEENVECNAGEDDVSEDGSEYVEIPDNEKNVECNAGEDDGSEEGSEHVASDNEENVECHADEDDETQSLYEDDGEGFPLPSVSAQIKSEDADAPCELDEDYVEYAQVYAESDDEASSDIYHNSSDLLTSKTSETSGNSLSSSKKRRYDATSSPGIQYEPNDEPLVKKARTREYQVNENRLSSSKKRSHDSASIPGIKYESADEPLLKKARTEEYQANEIRLSSSKKRTYDAASSPGIKHESDNEPSVKRARTDEYQANDSHEALPRKINQWSDKRLPGAPKSTGGKTYSGHQSSHGGKTLPSHDDSLESPAAVPHENHQYSDKRLPGAPRSTGGKAYSGHQSSHGGKTLPGQNRSLGGKSPLREQPSFGDKSLPGGGKSTSGKTPRSSVGGKTLLGQNNPLDGESSEDEHPPFGGKFLPGTDNLPSWPRHPDPEEDSDDDNYAAPAQSTRNHSARMSQPSSQPTGPPSAPPAATNKRPAKRSWTDAEHTAIEEVVRDLRKREAENGLVGKLGLRDERLWGYVSTTLKDDYAIDRTLAGCKYYWARFGRERSNFDERADKSANCKSTSVQHKKA